MLGSRRVLLLVTLAVAALPSACGDDDGGDAGPLTAEEVVAAFEEAAGGYPFETTTTLVDGAVAYAPRSSANPDEVAPLTDALGDYSVLQTVLIFEGESAPRDVEAAKAAAFSSKTFDDAGEGVYLGDNNFAYAAHENVVILGPVVDGDPDDPTFVRWKAVLDGL